MNNILPNICCKHLHSGTSNSDHFWRSSLVGVVLAVTTLGTLYIWSEEVGDVIKTTFPLRRVIK